MTDTIRKEFEAAYRAEYSIAPDDQYAFQRDALDESMYWNQIVHQRREGFRLARSTPSTSAEPAVAQREPKCEEGSCVEADGCPTEMAVLKRFWRAHQPDPQIVVAVDRDLLQQAAEHEFAYDYRDDRNYCTACRVFQAKTALPSNDHAEDCWRAKLQAVLAAWDDQQRANQALPTQAMKEVNP